MEELIGQMQSDLDVYVLIDKDSGLTFDLIEVSHVKEIVEKYIKLAWNHDN